MFFGGCVLMLGLWHTAFISATKNIPLATQSQNQENQIKVENYVHGIEPCETVLVGSSLMSLVLPEYFTHKNVCNIAFGGHSSFDGLNLVLQDRRHEIKNIFVEMTVLKSARDPFIQNATSGAQFALAHSLPIFLSRHQPMTMLLSLLRSFFPPGPKQITPEQFQTMFALHLAEHQITSTESQIAWQKSLTDINIILRQLKDFGIRIFLVQMPIDPRLQKTAGTEQRKDLNAEIFPATEWRWVEENIPDLTTTDGIHMTEISAKRFAQLLEQRF